MNLELIASVDAEWGLGYRGQLLVRVSPDLRRFKELTLNQRVIYGRRTLLTFPHARPLPGRENIILSRDPFFNAEEAIMVHSLTQLQEQLSGSREDGRRTFVIGGAEVYRQLLPWCTRAHITRLDLTRPADCWLPDLDADPAWQLSVRGPWQDWQGLRYSFCEYRRVGS